MPEIDKTPEVSTKSAESALARTERERLSRREALRKMGITSAMSVFALLSANDLARMAAEALKRHAGDSRVANLVADEFINAGVAFAGTLGGGNCPNTLTQAQRATCCSWTSVSNYCQGQNPTSNSGCSTCAGQVYGPNGYCTGYGGSNTTLAKGACNGRTLKIPTTT